MNLNDNSKRLKMVLDVFGISVSKAADEIGKVAGRAYSRTYVSRVINEGDFGSMEFFAAAEKALPNLIAQKTVNLFSLPVIASPQIELISGLHKDPVSVIIHP